METPKIYAITPRTPPPSPRLKKKVWLVKPPYFTPWTPPLGIAVLKSYLEQNGYAVECHDLNTDAELWGMHHQYFRAVMSQEEASRNEGYSTLWWVLNAHMLAYVNGAGPRGCARVLERILPLYNITPEHSLVNALLPLVEKYFERLGEVIDEYDLSGFGVAGTSTYTTSLASSLFILRRFKERHPEIKTVMGGGIFADDLALGSDNLTTLVEEYPFVDHMILGEGELLFLKLLEGELAHKRVISIADLKGKTLEMRDVPSPDFSDLNINDYFHLTIEGARSCPFQCNFCSETIQWGDYRKKPMSVFADQVIELARGYGNNSFFMGDSLMNPYINEFSQLLLEKQGGILYDGYLRADKPVTHRDRVKVWARSGLYRVRLGIESAATRVLESMDKMTSPRTISEVLKSLASAGIRTTTYWIVGFPGETEEDFQETLDFIRENHRSIYELEAHPYYYYPYGQVGSRLYQCDSLYPEDVTEIIKFRAWDVAGLKPTREERYERLRRISQLASELGLPNIYTMAERYVAEDRWRRLHPLAVDVYQSESAGRRREKAQPTEAALGLFAPEEGRPSSPLAFASRVSKRLNPETLAAALGRLVEYHELLQVSLSDGAYRHEPEAPGEEGRRLRRFQIEAEGEENIESFIGAAVATLSGELRPRRGDSLRAALFEKGDGTSDLVLLAHPAVIDAQGLALLCEDLHRLYEQLAQGLEPDLAPAEHSYAEALAAAGPAPVEHAPSACGREGGRGEAGSFSMLLDGAQARRVLNAPDALRWFRPAELLLLALARSFGRVSHAAPVAIDATHDYRLTRAGFERVVGSLTCVRRLSPSTPSELCGATPAEMQDALGRISRGAESPSDAGAHERRVLLDLERFVREPWLGGDEWRPLGLFPAVEKIRPGYRLHVAPLHVPDGVRVEFRYEPGGELEELAREASALLPRELEEIVRACEEYAAAEEFWGQALGEGFAAHAAEPGRQTEAEPWHAANPHQLDLPLLEAAARSCDASISEVLLAAYGLLLSRLNDEQEVLVLFSAARPQKSLFPVRLRPSWELSFEDYLELTKQHVAEARRHSASVFDILSRLVAAGATTDDATHSAPIFDTGFVYCETNDAEGARSLKEVVEERMGGGGAGLLLLAIKDAGGCTVQFHHRVGREHSTMAESLGSFLESILEEVAECAEL